MIYDDEWADDVHQHRLEAIRKSIRPVTVEELVKLGAERFPLATDPWCERYQEFLKEHPRSNFYLAHFYAEDSEQQVEVIYCSETHRGMWFLPGKGMGKIQPAGLAELKEIVGRM